MTALCEALGNQHCRLTNLNLYHNDVGNEGARMLCYALREGQCKLKVLGLKYCYLTRNTCMQQSLALVSKQPYFPNIKYLKIVVIFTLSIFLQKNVKIMKKL